MKINLLAGDSLVAVGASSITIIASAFLITAAGGMKAANQVTTLSSSSETAVLSSVPSDYVAQTLTGLNITNPTGGAITVTISIKRGGTNYPLYTKSVGAGETFAPAA